MVRENEVTAPEVTDTSLARIERLNPTLRAFITVTGDQARAAAAGRPSGSLAGVPFSAKDNLFTAGVPTTIGSVLLRDFVPDVDAGAVGRVLAAGGVLVGKSNLPEFSSYGRSINHLAGECRNPWDTTRTSGGSSGGAAVGVAVGLVPLAIGSDDGGSIRLPAALNGVFGLLPSPGRIPMDGAVVVAQISAVGPLTRDVRDAAVFLDLMTGEDAEGTLDDGVSGLRVAWVHDHAVLPLTDPRVAETARAAVFALALAGATVSEPGVVLTNTWGAATTPTDDSPRYGGIHPYEMPAFVAAVAADPDWRDRLCPYSFPDRIAGTVPPYPTDPAARAQRAAAVGQLHWLLRSYDLVATPTIDQVAPVIPPDHSRYPYGPPNAPVEIARQSYSKYTIRVNMAGCTAASVPAGFVDGMPVGLQLIGRPGDEARVLRAARALEQLRPWAGRRPPVL